MSPKIAIAVSLIAFSASMITLIGKEYFDRRRQKINSVNTLLVLVRMLMGSLETSPEFSGHISVEKVMSILPDIGFDEELRNAFLSFETALRRYRAGWRQGSSPGRKEIGEITSILEGCDAVLSGYVKKIVL